MVHLNRPQPVIDFNQSRPELTDEHPDDESMPVMRARGIIVGLILAVPLWGMMGLSVMAVSHLVR